MAEPLTNAILASILHLIRRDLTENGRVPPRRAPPRWIPPRAASYTPATPSPPQERTKGGNAAPTVLAHGTITVKSIRAISIRAIAVTIWYTLHPKDASRP
jgi:hypothetical protein